VTARPTSEEADVTATSWTIRTCGSGCSDAGSKCWLRASCSTGSP